MAPSNRLSKTRYQCGLQCSKYLWLSVHERELADPLTERTEAVFATGHRVGELARERFAGGVLVDAPYYDTEKALADTSRLIAEGAEVLYEAAFEFAGVLVRADILVRRGRIWDLVEVKSSTKCRGHYLTDAAVQTWVLEGAGLSVGRTYLMHLDNTYVYEGGEYDLDRLFLSEDVTDSARALIADVPALSAQMREMLLGPCPEVRIGRRCDEPYTCGFYGYCHKDLPAFPVTEIPRISSRALDALLDDGLWCILDVPADHAALNAAQREACMVIQNGERRVLGDLAATLDGVRNPVHYLDFETFMPALPLFVGTRAYQAIAFQWSDHIVSADGSMEHREFLFDGEGDPRQYFVDSLLSACEGEGSVVVYSGYENRILGELARDLPESAEALESLRGRLFDLERVIRQHVRHPDFHGRTSIKVVLPALVADLSYEGSAIADGDTAMLRYEALSRGLLGVEERAQTLSDLREDCRLDTLAMVRVHDALRQIA